MKRERAEGSDTGRDEARLEGLKVYVPLPMATPCRSMWMGFLLPALPAEGLDWAWD